MRDLIERAAQTLRGARKALALTGAGISAESGIPTFRTDLTSWVSDFIIQEKAGIAIPQVVAAIRHASCDA